VSVNIEIHVEGLDDLRSKIETLDSATKNHIHDKLIEQGEILRNTAQAFAPRRTGYLESTIYARVRDWVLKVGATASYAAFVEFGTRFIQPRRFLARALEYCMPGLVRSMHEAVDDAIREAKG